MTPPAASPPELHPQVGTGVDTATRLRSHRTGTALLSLALGGVALGTAEFASMGVLPSVAESLQVPEPTAGTLISA